MSSMITGSFKVESGVPMPPAGSGARTKYPFGNMAIGDSFAVPADAVKRVGPASVKFGKERGLKFAVRKMANGEFRVWRTA